MADKERIAKGAIEGGMRKRGASDNGTVYRSAATGRYVTRSADRDPSARAREIRGRFRAAGRPFSDSAKIVREDRDDAD